MQIKQAVTISMIISMSFVYSHGLAVHVNHIDNVLQYYLDNYGDDNPYYEIINTYQEYFKYGSILPDMQYVNSLKPKYQELYNKIEERAGVTLTYQIGMDEVPDPEVVGSYSFGINTHDYRYAFQFAHYLLDQANADPNDPTAQIVYDGTPFDPPGVDPGCVGVDNCVPRGQKLALALGYYSHLVQDLINHNFLVPKATAESGLAELNLLNEDNSGLAHIPAIQSHFVIESMQDYRLGVNANAEVADLVYNDFWVHTSQLEPSVGPVYYPGDFDGYVGLNPALDFFWEVLNKWYTNNPLGLPDDYRQGLLISKTGLVQECNMWRFGNRFYPELIGYGSFPNTLSTWISSHVDGNPILDLGYILLGSLFGPGVGFTGWIMDAIDETVTTIAYGEANEDIVEKSANSVHIMLGIMNNDIALADEIASTYPDLVNIAEYNRLKTNPVFTNPNYFDYFPYYQDLETLYFDQIGPSGELYQTWSPDYHNAYTWGVLNALNGYSSTLEMRTDIGVYDAYFKVDGVRHGPNSELGALNDHQFQVVAELFALENMTSSIPIIAKLFLDHSTNLEQDILIKSKTVSMNQNPELYNNIERLHITIDFDILILQTLIYLIIPVCILNFIVLISHFIPWIGINILVWE